MMNKIKSSSSELRAQISKLQKTNTELHQTILDIRSSTKYQIGYQIANVSSFKTLIFLPIELYRIYQQHKLRKLRRVKVLTSTEANNLGVVKKSTQLGGCDMSLSANNQHDEQARISSLQVLFNEKFDSNAGIVKVAGIMDEFTYHSYAPECQILALEPENLTQQLEGFSPDFIFIESAWQGKESLWKTKVSNFSDEVRTLIYWCRANKVPCILWNKEDPVHFGTFLSLAKAVDYVFTTDVDCIGKYKKEVGHERVYLLPFAAQPKTHNPIEKYDRQDKFCFAGSYYLRYPERQRDFASIVDAVTKLKPLDVYDRNFDNPHPHYTFPDKYKNFILGVLPFEEIDKAYKGYNFGINMNTIKQSQTMFARRVYELLASNTVVVSNFSRGVKSTFGDLVVCSDSTNEIRKQLSSICNDDTQFRKYRLLGLRKVMQEHTYSHRFALISSILSNQNFTTNQKSVLVVAKCANETEEQQILFNFNRQCYVKKTLVIYRDYKSVKPPEVDAIVTDTVTSFSLAIKEFSSTYSFISLFKAGDYYGENYLTDLLLASQYSFADAFGKKAYFTANNNVIKMQHNGSQYHPCEELDFRQSIMKISKANLKWLTLNFKQLPTAKIAFSNMLSIDEFNYCRNGMSCDLEVLDRTVGDLKLASQGINYVDELSFLSKKLPSALPMFKDSESMMSINAKEFTGFFEQPKTSKVDIQYVKGNFVLTSKYNKSEHAYYYANKIFEREELNLVLNSLMKFDGRSNIEDVRTVVEFQDDEHKKISHAMHHGIGKQFSLAIPEHCRFIRLGIRVQGKGSLVIRRIIFGEQLEQPSTIIGQSSTLVLTKQYPSYDDLYKYGFLHSRIRSYREAGQSVDVFRITNEPGLNYREFEGVDVAQGSAELLDRALSTGRYRHVLVHLLDKNMWQVLSKYLDTIKVTVWAHGAEIQLWQRREFEFELMSDLEVERQKKLSDQRKLFWQSVLTNPSDNLHMVFVSKYFRDEVFNDFGVNLDDKNYSVISNIIDTNIFPYSKKTAEHRLKLLSIRPYASRKYANDLTVKAILELSNKPFFDQLEFCLVGDGRFYEETTKPLQRFDNVKLIKGFQSQQEIAELHKAYGVFLTPTRMDSQGVSRDEAMSSGLVAITTSVAAIPEFIDNTCGYVVPAEDYLAMSSAIEELYYDQEKFLKLSAAASKRVSETLSFEQTILAELQLIKERC